jgi:arylsulfatase A-like enzyme
MPTLAELAGVKPATDIDGISVVASLLGKKQEELGYRFMYWESPPPNLHQVVRWRHWKAWRRPNRPLELYDLAKDPREEHDVAKRHPDVVARFLVYLKTARTESPNWPTAK